jgi:hypothetical protein
MMWFNGVLTAMDDENFLDRWDTILPTFVTSV